MKLLRGYYLSKTDCYWPIGLTKFSASSSSNCSNILSVHAVGTRLVEQIHDNLSNLTGVYMQCPKLHTAETLHYMKCTCSLHSAYTAHTLAIHCRCTPVWSGLESNSLLMSNRTSPKEFTLWLLATYAAKIHEKHAPWHVSLNYSAAKQLHLKDGLVTELLRETFKGCPFFIDFRIISTSMTHRTSYPVSTCLTGKMPKATIFWMIMNELAFKANRG